MQFRLQKSFHRVFQPPLRADGIQQAHVGQGGRERDDGAFERAAAQAGGDFSGLVVVAVANPVEGKGLFGVIPGFEDDLYKLKHHSVGRAFLYSLILPGAGEIYTGSKLKASLFFGIEIFSWYQYINKYGDGQDLEDQYRDYANQYWDPGDYRAWLVDVMGVPSDTLPYRGEDGEPQTFTHHLPDFKTQQYYEMIGKYEQFVFGWADTDYNEGDSLSKTHRVTYLQLRDESNSKFDAARNYAIVSIANRIISAFDAALSARKLNKKADRFSEVRLKARLADYYGERIPKIILTYNFY